MDNSMGLFWSFDPFPKAAANTRPQTRHRGVMYWTDGDDRRILFTAGMHLYALDARTGAQIASFGHEGRVDLRTGLPRDTTNMFVRLRTRIDLSPAGAR